MKTKSLIKLLALFFAGVLLSSSLSATLYVYEGFDYSLADSTSMDGVTTNATGLSGTYDDNSSGGSATYSSTGLTFGSNYLTTTGGSLYQTASGTSSYTVLVADISATVSESTTIWSSFLVQIEEFSTEGAVKVRLRYDDNGTTRFLSTVDASGDSQNTAVGYDSSETESSSSLTAGITYLVLSSYTNVGDSEGGDATQWIFTLDGYESWLSTGGGLEDTLSDYAYSTITDSGTTKSFATQINFVLGGSGTGTESAYIDELRYGSSLSDVIAVPELATFALFLGLFSGAVLLVRRRR
jgi:hypothetical protein